MLKIEKKKHMRREIKNDYVVSFEKRHVRCEIEKIQQFDKRHLSCEIENDNIYRGP